MRFAAVLPTAKCYGGVRRYFEIGNELVCRGHDYILFIEDSECKEPFKPDWFTCNFPLYSTAWVTDHNMGDFDYVIASEHCFSQYIRIKAKKRVYYSIADEVNAMSLSMSDIVAANSTRQMRNMKKHGHDALDWIGGINTDFFKPLPCKKLSPPQIVFHGKWSPYKATGYIVRGVEWASRRQDLIMAPYGLRDKVEARCKCDASKYYRLTQEQMVTMYNESTIAIAIELAAGWCNAASEAMACGVPVICGRVGTEDFAVDGENALIVPETDTKAIGAAIVRLLDDSKLRQKFIRTGLETIKKYNWPTLVDKIENTLCG